MTASISWNLDPPPGFQGLHTEKPVEMYLRHLPHWRQPGATYFVTFRLADSLPAAKLNELKSFRDEWMCKYPPPRSKESMDELWRQTFCRVDRWLDQGYGDCLLRDPSAAREVVDSLLHFDGERYELGCFTVMLNHVHLVVRPFEEDQKALERIMHSWKRFISREINKLNDRQGVFWQEESFDRIVRDEEHLWKIIQYIGRNPRNAGLDREKCPTWIRPEWEAIGWKFLDSNATQT